MSILPFKLLMTSSISHSEIPNMKKILLTFMSVLILVPAVMFAQAPPLDYSGFVKCDGVVVGKNSDGTPQPGVASKPGEEKRQEVCDFALLMETVIKAINWLFIITIPIVTVLFAYSGVLYMSGREANLKKAREIFTTVAIGFIIMITAWIAVRTAVEWFVDDDFTGATTFVK